MWFQTASQQTLELPEDASEEVSHRVDVQNSLKSVIERGWNLIMTDEGSPADKAGIDFIWYHPQFGWFPIDTTAMNKVGIPDLIHIATIQNAQGRGECKMLRAEDKTRFVELLVRLSESTPYLTGALLPPSLKARGNARKALIAFQKRLEERSAEDNGELFSEWAAHLRKAIGYECEMNKRAQKPQIADFRGFLVEVIQKHIRIFMEQGIGIKRLRGVREAKPFARDYSICYHPSTDILATPEPSTPQVQGLGRLIDTLFSQAYGEAVAESGLSDSLIAKKRFFDGRGKEEVIHAALDALERRYKKSDHRFRKFGKKKRRSINH